MRYISADKLKLMQKSTSWKDSHHHLDIPHIAHQALTNIPKPLNVNLFSLGPFPPLRAFRPSSDCSIMASR